ncbi:DUF4345 family protein [Pseudohoeflea coraliihabitans]|uniref:DUF4345 family protein n=1 Tax=Pseudohoeflea coraliihabitans TaxID=2860393 RepID=A0ABS6WL84_9HYPH|nr:DUF4345 family protein [Pseudohoeflea sp. DP4N28-3]MBW3096716.1 DUF4345 family protein [Pseudohoeflea sp. DP4N28-3]
MLSFYVPSETSELLAWVSALVTIFFGLLLLVAPRLSFRILRIQTVPRHPEAVAEGRGTMAGFYLGVGLCAIVFAQPLLYIALGAGWGFTALGRLMSMLFDRGLTLFNLISVCIEAALAAAPLLYAVSVM